MNAYSGQVPEAERKADWRDGAACTDSTKDLWFPDRTDEKTIRAGKKVCWSCPAIQECLTYAYAEQEDRGTWGGFTEWERRAVHGRTHKDAGDGAGVQASGRRRKASA